MGPETYTLLLERALDEEIGLKIKVTNPETFYQYLINAKTAGDGKYSDLSVCYTTEPGTLLIVKKTTDLNNMG